MQNVGEQMFQRLSDMLHGPSVPEIDVEEADRRLEAGAQLVDVRKPSEWNEGHIPGTVHIPLGDLAGRASELDPSRPVVALCRSGNRSKTAVQLLQRAGFVESSSMAGGVMAWARAGKPLER
jgi:rhodanese-related sulfurtransferase